MHLPLTWPSDRRSRASTRRISALMGRNTGQMDFVAVGPMVRGAWLTHRPSHAPLIPRKRALTNAAARALLPGLHLHNRIGHKMVKVAYSEAFDRFFFNLSGAVGPQCANNIDDVELVRFGIFCTSKAPSRPSDNAKDRDEFKAAALKVGFVGGYDPTVGAAIKAFQKFSGRQLDSTVSVIAGNNTPNGQTWVLQTLLANMAAEYPNMYPRIDQVFETGPTITARVRKLFVGTN